jgi:hypothetical protein
MEDRSRGLRARTGLIAAVTICPDGGGGGRNSGARRSVRQRICALAVGAEPSDHAAVGAEPSEHAAVGAEPSEHAAVGAQSSDHQREAFCAGCGASDVAAEHGSSTCFRLRRAGRANRKNMPLLARVLADPSAVQRRRISTRGIAARLAGCASRFPVGGLVSGLTGSDLRVCVW